MFWFLLFACDRAPPPQPSTASAPAQHSPRSPEVPSPGALVHRPVQLPARSGPLPYTTDLLYLQDELAWIEARVRRLSLTRKIQESEEAPSPARLARLASRRAMEDRLRQNIDERCAVSPPTALDRLCAALELTTFERLVLLLAAAPCCSRRFEDIFGMLDKDGAPNTLTVEVVFNFAELPFNERIRHRSAFSPSSALVREDLVVVDMRQRTVAPRDLLMADLELTGRAFSFLIGDAGVADELAAFSSVESPLANLDDIVLPAPDRRRILAAVDNHAEYLRLRTAWGLDDVVRYGRGVLLLFHGPPGTGKTMTAHGLAQRMGRRLLNVDVPTFMAHEEAGRFLPSLFREARLQNAVLFFDECETLLRSRSAGNILMSVLLTELERFDGVAVLATNLPTHLDEAIARRIMVRIPYHRPDAEARRAIWERHLPPSLPRAADVDLDTLAARHPLSGGDIKNAVLAAVADALHAGQTDGLRQAHLEQAARQQLSRPTDVPLLHPTQRLDTLIVPAPVRKRLEGIVRAVSSGQDAVIALTGPAGSGRSTCAAALAGSLGRPLLPASPATLHARLPEVTRQRAVLHIQGLAHTAVEPELLRQLSDVQGLLLIECDDTSALTEPLQALLSAQVNLPFPDLVARATLWRRLLPAETDADPDQLAEHPLSGGQIAQVIASLQVTDRPVNARTLRDALSSMQRTVGF